VKVRRYFAHRLGVLVATVVAAVAIAHVFLNATVEGYRLTTAIRGTPAYLFDGFVRGDFGATIGGGCRPRSGSVRPDGDVKPCASYPAGEIDDLLRERVPIDLQLLLGGMLLGSLAGVVGGRMCAMRPGSAAARFLRAATAFLLSCPPYFLAFLILIYFADGSGMLFRLPFVSGVTDYVPPGENPVRWFEAMWVPWLLCALPLAAWVLRITDTTLREVLHEDYVRTARAKGLPEWRVLTRHALANAAVPIVTVIGIGLALLIGGVVVTESVYAIPGLGRLTVDAVLARDFPTIQGVILLFSVAYVLINLAIDLSYLVLDPRIRY
jgi:peptide/nickel transport system permease protein